MIGTRNGKLSIFDCSGIQPTMIINFYVTGGNALNHIEFDSTINYAFLCGYEGCISIVDVDK